MVNISVENSLVNTYNCTTFVMSTYLYMYMQCFNELLLFKNPIVTMFSVNTGELHCQLQNF